jgi:hypothetical protein
LFGLLAANDYISEVKMPQWWLGFWLEFLLNFPSNGTISIS